MLKILTYIWKNIPCFYFKIQDCLDTRGKMLFIFGSPRSGTTLLSQALNAHDEIVVPHESDFIIPVAYILDRIKDADIGRDMIYKMIVHSEYYETGRSISEFLDKDDIKRTVYSTGYNLAMILDAIYKAMADKKNKKVGGDKSPNDILGLRILVKNNAFSDKSFIVHIVRDIRDVMVSLNKAGWVNDLDLYFPRMWTDSNLYLYSVFKSQKNRYLLVRYEDMVKNPVKIYSNICKMLGVKFQEKMLNPSNRHPFYKNSPEHKNLFKPITSNRVGIYKSALDHKRIKNYEMQAQEAIRAFGYSIKRWSFFNKVK